MNNERTETVSKGIKQGWIKDFILAFYNTGLRIEYDFLSVLTNVCYVDSFIERFDSSIAVRWLNKEVYSFISFLPSKRKPLSIFNNIPFFRNS